MVHSSCCLTTRKMVFLITFVCDILAEKRELTKQKPRGKTDEALISQISPLESNITVAKDDLVIFFPNLFCS